jgi:hypothetical protein
MCARATRPRLQAEFNRRVPNFRKRRLGAERLEVRQLLAGDVSASVVRGTLVINGDNADNFVEVFGTGTAGQFVVEGFTDNHGVNTTINHSSNPQTFNGVTNISVTLKRGDDFFGFEQGTVAGNLNIDMGDGNNEVNVGIPKLVSTFISSPTARPLLVTIPTSAATINGALCINLGTGNGWLIEGSTHVMGTETVNTCNGNDRIEFIDTGGVEGEETIGNGVTVDHDLAVNLGGGSNYLDAYDLTVNGSFKVNGSGTNDIDLAVLNVAKDAVFNLCGRGNQTFFLGPEPEVGTIVATQQNHVGGDLIVNTGGGNDDVTESSLSVGGSNKINTDGGNDSVILGDLDDDPPEVNYQVTVANDLIVNLGCGTDSLTADNVRPAHNFIISQGLGNSTISLTAIYGPQLLKITTDGGQDHVTLNGLGITTVMVDLGAGNDSLSVTQATVSISTFEGGTGVNTYTDGGGNFIPNLTKRHFV